MPKDCRAYGYSDVIRNQLRTMTANEPQKDRLVLVVCPFMECC
jgi:hypothetical protein